MEETFFIIRCLKETELTDERAYWRFKIINEHGDTGCRCNSLMDAMEYISAQLSGPNDGHFHQQRN